MLPLMIRSQDPNEMRALGGVLADILKEQRGLLVASTDLSHFYRASTAEKLDHTIIQAIEDFDPEAVFRAEARGEGFACGKSALAAVMWAARGLGANHAQDLHYAHSGHVTGDKAQVVGYTAAVFTRV
jgi:AmmeMemoRadiSam system protein B